MNNEVRIHWERTIRRKGTPEVTERKTTYQKTETLLGNGQARVERTRYAKHGIGYGEFAISGSCTVSIACDQTDTAIVEACQKAGQITDQVMKQDNIKMSRIVEMTAKELEEDA